MATTTARPSSYDNLNNRSYSTAGGSTNGMGGGATATSASSGGATGADQYERRNDDQLSLLTNKVSALKSVCFHM